MKKIKWGILSTAKIGLEKVIPAMQQGKHCEMAAIASRTQESAREAAKHLKIPKAYGSYHELLDDASIDAVYIPLPNHMHVPWTIKALAAGKHVLCEKPIALTAAENPVHGLEYEHIIPDEHHKKSKNCSSYAGKKNSGQQVICMICAQ